MDQLYIYIYSFLITTEHSVLFPVLYSRFSLVIYFILSRTSMVAQLVKNLPAVQETRVWSLGWEDCLRRKWQPTPVFLPGKSRGQRSLGGYSPWAARVEHNLVTKLPPVNPNLPIHPTIPFPLWCPYICSLCLCLYFCFVNRFIYAIFSRFHMYALI